MKSGTKDILAVLETIFFVLVLILFLMFAPFIKVDENWTGSSESVNGYSLIFGNSDKGFGFSIFGFITFLCLIAAILLCIVKLFVVNSDTRTIINIFVIIFFGITCRCFLLLYEDFNDGRT